MYKYMRIQGREDSYITKYPKGIFSLCWNLIRDKAMTEDEEKLFVSIDDWFKDNLPEPEPCKNHEMVITFFKCESTGPALFKQKRLGKNQKVFTVYNFRTMCDHAFEKGGVASSEQDSRITKVGKFLRKTSLDEIPQMINIIK